MRLAVLWIVLSLLIPQTGGAAAASKAHRFNIRISPLGLLLGDVWGDLTIGLGPIAIGPLFEYASLESTLISLKGWGAGLRLMVFPGGHFEDGVYLSFGGEYGDFTTTVSGATVASRVTMGSAVVGYGWYWGLFNFSLAAGAKYTSYANPSLTSGIGLSGEVMAGFALF